MRGLRRRFEKGNLDGSPILSIVPGAKSIVVESRDINKDL